jgi:hypothetical protein
MTIRRHKESHLWENVIVALVVTMILVVMVSILQVTGLL